MRARTQPLDRTKLKRTNLTGMAQPCSKIVRRDAPHDSGIKRPLFVTGPSLDMLHPR